MGKITRRELLGQSALLLGTAETPLLALGLEKDNEATAEKKLRIVIVGAHPDDPESGCGGTIADPATRLYADIAHVEADHSSPCRQVHRDCAGFTRNWRFRHTKRWVRVDAGATDILQHISQHATIVDIAI